eukprot:scaffold122_cov387-Prasinococcus_capsulatus_cf.AAC.8
MLREQAAQPSALIDQRRQAKENVKLQKAANDLVLADRKKREDSLASISASLRERSSAARQKDLERMTREEQLKGLTPREQLKLAHDEVVKASKVSRAQAAASQSSLQKAKEQKRQRYIVDRRNSPAHQEALDL